MQEGRMLEEEEGKGKGRRNHCEHCDTGCGAHICNNLLVLERYRKLSMDEMILRLGDGKTVAAEAVGSLNLVIGDHIRIELKNCYYVPSMIKNIIFISILDNDAAKLLKFGWFKTVSEPYEIWHGKPAFYKFDEYPKETAGYYFCDPPEQKIFVSRNAVFLKEDFPTSSRRDEALLEETSEIPQQNNATPFEPTVPTDCVPVLCKSTRESRPLDRYGFLGLTSQLENDPRTYGEAMSNIDFDNWLEVMKSKTDSMGSNQLWTLVDPPNGVKPVECK
ncbi:UNVERIFIED_CONTAM: hypothetical protein Scaly_2211300 [Sesamum calycinum]|uniref:Uncharacterized protein n=1 Tax=Sesamum calycinum TaxID=2727403 RepID=A0AAW2MRC4_9LAMI